MSTRLSCWLAAWGAGGRARRTQWDPARCRLGLETPDRAEQQQAAALDSFHFLDEGWDSWVYTARDLQGREWSLRFPKRSEVVDQLDREIALLPVLAPRLPLAVPRFSLLGQPGEGYPHRFVGYPRLLGQTVLERLEDAVEVASCGKTLGAFLTVLHAFPVQEARRLGVEVEQEEGLVEWAAECEAGLLEFGARLGAGTRALELLRHPSPPSTGPVLLHNDFFPEHLLVEGGRLMGVIDWGDVALGDPGADLAGLFAWGAIGEQAGEEREVREADGEPSRRPHSSARALNSAQSGSAGRALQQAGLRPLTAPSKEGLAPWSVAGNSGKVMKSPRAPGPA